MGALAGRFAFFREHYMPPEDETTLWTLRRLEHEPRMVQAWASLDRHDPEAFQHVLYCILGDKWKADSFAAYPTWKAKIEAHHERLAAAATTLSEFFDGLNISEEDNGTIAGSMREMNDHIRECRSSLRWAKDYIARTSEISRLGLKRDMPASQKRESPHVAFCVLLCKSLNDRIGQPLYGFVATAATVVYQLNEELSVDAVRRAYERDKAKKAEAG